MEIVDSLVKKINPVSRDSCKNEILHSPPRLLYTLWLESDLDSPGLGDSGIFSSKNLFEDPNHPYLTEITEGYVRVEVDTSFLPPNPENLTSLPAKKEVWICSGHIPKEAIKKLP